MGNKGWIEGRGLKNASLSVKITFSSCCHSALVISMRWLLSPLTPPFLGFLEMEQGWKKERMEIPIAYLSTEQWLRWGLGEGDGRGREMESALEGEAKRLLSRWYGCNYSSALSLPVIVVSGSQHVLEICWNSRDLGFPPGMELNFPLGTTCPAPVFAWGVGRVNP